jgi:hypothetical protein
MNAPFCKPVFIRTTDSKTEAVSKLRAMLGMILNGDIYIFENIRRTSNRNNGVCKTNIMILLTSSAERLTFTS